MSNERDAQIINELLDAAESYALTLVAAGVSAVRAGEFDALAGSRASARRKLTDALRAAMQAADENRRQ